MIKSNRTFEVFARHKRDMSLPQRIKPRRFGRAITSIALGGLALAPVALSAKPVPGTFTLTLSADTTIPLGDKFTPTGDKATTATDGAYSFAIAPSVNTQYRAVAKTKPVTESQAVLVKVRPRVDGTVSDSTPTTGARVTFAGAVLPARDGASALVQRRKAGRWKTVAKATLTDAGNEQSAYTKAITVRSDGTYRVKVAKDAEHVAGVSSRQKIDVS